VESLYSKRMLRMPKSFVREILKVTSNPEIISFAGGLPNADSFPVTEIAEACASVLSVKGESALQYSTTQGVLELRETIAQDLQKRLGHLVDPDGIVITCGAQQGLDLIGKVFIDWGDVVAIESPGYLGAIQAFGTYEPSITTIPLTEDGLDLDVLASVLDQQKPKLVYVQPTFQNPSGITYSTACRQRLAELIRGRDVLLVEDDPYSQLRFEGEASLCIKSLLPTQSILLGTFSKIVAPGLRIGWLYGPKDVVGKVIIAKQGSDLHTSTFAQHILHRYLKDNDVPQHLQAISSLYKQRRDCMLRAIRQCFPKDVRFMVPAGGMFLWLTLPKGVSSLDLFDLALKEKVAFVPGTPFFTGGRGERNMRLNFSNADEDKIEIGIQRLAKAVHTLMCTAHQRKGNNDD
jgi:2-aminoadipate transaminase